MMIAEPGEMVRYENDGRGGFRYWLPAIVVVTQENENVEAAEAGGIPVLSGPGHVHLQVLSPGTPYVEHDVPMGASGEPRSWRYPSPSFP